MELEFKRVDEFRSLELFLKNGDYLYEHFKDEYPLKNEFDLANLYFVTESSGQTLQVHSMAENKERQLTVEKLENNWWIMKLPDFIRKKIGLE